MSDTLASAPSKSASALRSNPCRCKRHSLPGDSSRYATSTSNTCAQNGSSSSVSHSFSASQHEPHTRGRRRRNCDRRRRTTESSTPHASIRSSANSAIERETSARSSNTSTDLRQARSCEELISPRYSTCRCRTRPPGRRRFSTMRKSGCTLPSFRRRVARRNMAAHYPHANPEGNKQGLHYSRLSAVIHRPAFDFQAKFFAARAESAANPLSLAKNLSVNSYTTRPSRMERGVGQDNGEARRIVGGDGCILGARGTASAPSGAVAGQEVPTQARCWAPLEAGAAGVRGHRVRASYRLPMEGLAQGALWQRQRHPQALPGLGRSGLLRGPVEGGAGRIRRDGGHRLAMAKCRRGHDEGPLGAGSRRPEPDGSGEKRAANATCWWTT